MKKNLVVVNVTNSNMADVVKWLGDNTFNEMNTYMDPDEDCLYYDDGEYYSGAAKYSRHYITTDSYSITEAHRVVDANTFKNICKLGELEDKFPELFI